ncbi:hypothetical protein ABIF96_006001 [Bradyrhizobium ottawaense]
MLRLDLVMGIVEIDEIARKHVDRADREADLLLVDEIEVDQLEQALLQRHGVVIAGRGARADRAEPGIHLVRGEESGLAHRRGHPGAGEIAPLAEDVAVGRVVPDLAVGDALPEDAQRLEPLFRLVAGDDGGVDRADRDTADPVGLDAGLVQRLIDTGLVGAERAAALQHQRDAIAAFGPPAPRGRLMALICRMRRAGVHGDASCLRKTIASRGDGVMTGRHRCIAGNADRPRCNGRGRAPDGKASHRSQ